MDHPKHDYRRQTPDDAKFTLWSEQIKASSHHAFTELFNAMHAPLLRHAYRYTSDTEAARDIVQNAFLKIWEWREKLEPKKSLKSLLYTIARNLSLNHKRSRRPSTEQPLDSFVDYRVPSADDILDGMILQKHLRQFINELPPKRKQAFVLSRYYEMSHKEIAQEMGVKHRTVNTHIVHALRDLKARLASLGTIRKTHE